MLKRFFIGFLLASTFLVPSASAQNSILPHLDPEWDKLYPCDPSDEKWDENYGFLFNTDDYFITAQEADAEGEYNFDVEIENVLACAIKTGHVRIWMIPYLVRDILNFLIGLAGLISILMILVGAYYYIIGGLSDDKEKGKNILTYAIGGLVSTILSWTLVNFVLLILTS